MHTGRRPPDRPEEWRRGRGRSCRGDFGVITFAVRDPASTCATHHQQGGSCGFRFRPISWLNTPSPGARVGFRCDPAIATGDSDRKTMMGSQSLVSVASRALKTGTDEDAHESSHSVWNHLCPACERAGETDTSSTPAAETTSEVVDTDTASSGEVASDVVDSTGPDETTADTPEEIAPAETTPEEIVTADACAAYPCGLGATCGDLPFPAPADATGRICRCEDGLEGDPKPAAPTSTPARPTRAARTRLAPVW